MIRAPSGHWDPVEPVGPDLFLRTKSVGSSKVRMGLHKA